MESAAYWSPLGFFTSWRHLNLIVCQTVSPSHLNEHAKGEVQFVSPQLENVSLESLLVLSCESFLGLMGSGLNKLFQILYRYPLPWARCFSSSAFLPTTQCFQAFTCYPKSEYVNIFCHQSVICASHPVGELQVMIGVRTLLGLLLNCLRESEIRDQNMCNSV